MDLPARPPVPLAAAQRWVAIAALMMAAVLPGAALAQSPAGTGGAAPAQAPVPPAAAPALAARPVVDAITCQTGCLGIARATPDAAGWAPPTSTPAAAATAMT